MSMGGIPDKRKSGQFTFEEPDTPLSKKGRQGTVRKRKTDDISEIPPESVLISPSKLSRLNRQPKGQVKPQTHLHDVPEDKDLIVSPRVAKPISSSKNARANPRTVIAKEKRKSTAKIPTKETHESVTTSPSAVTVTVTQKESELPVLKHVRFEALKKVLNKSLQESTKSLSFSKVKQCYPELAENKDGIDALNLGRLQLLEFWEKTCLNEFNAIYEERDLERKLNQLDEMIYEAKIRKSKGGIEGTEKPLLLSKIKPEELVANKVTFTKENINKELSEKLKELKKENAKLLKEFDSISDTSTSCITKIKGNLEYLQRYLNVETVENSISEDKLDDLIDYITKNYIEETS